MIELADIRAAASRIAAHVRRTPTVASRPTRVAPGYDGPLTLKLEALQITGSFKPRGAIAKLKSLPEDRLARGIVTASGGNHGLGVAYAGHVAGRRAVVYLPRTVAQGKIDRIAAWGAEIVVEGEVWDESNRAALARAEAEGMAYFHPFADPATIAGQGTVALELLEDAPDVDTILVAIGGGGLIAGIALAAKTLKPGIGIVGIEPTGAPTLYESVRAGRVVELPKVETAAVTLAPRASAAINFDLIRKHVAEIVLVTDAEMREAARWLWLEQNVAAELSGAAAIAALMAGRYRPAPGERVAAIVCGAGTDGIS